MRLEFYPDSSAIIYILFLCLLQPGNITQLFLNLRIAQFKSFRQRIFPWDAIVWYCTMDMILIGIILPEFLK